ncbi:hypothetical protein SAMN05444141_104207 [Pseudovibrio denitrificans]|uniref:Uncharacterized protein n=1 Tax=Pseudovibrio denitrificans TaxID=258256 RepID=A0A1I7BQT5_9HYPH|nr:DUF6653 family protein [Pseudovibrio denitrificans]SFT89529.1 hypothetical protein SAMN05444141_104207 [Pseudovibrio denitrificans]
MAGDPKLSQMQPQKIGGWDPRHVRHLNTQSAALTRLNKPKSLLVRALVLPALLAPLWYQPTLGWFWAVALSVAAVAWVWIIPPFGKKNVGAQTWAQKAILGERMWLNRMFVPIPAPYHQKALALLVVGLIAVGLAIWAAATNNLPLMLTGGIIAYLAKFTSLFVMVKIFEHMKNAHPLYKSWRNVPVNDNSLKAKAG